MIKVIDDVASSDDADGEIVTVSLSMAVDVGDAENDIVSVGVPDVNEAL